MHSYGDVTMSLKGCKNTLEQGGAFCATPEVTMGLGFCSPISRLYDKPRPQSLIKHEFFERGRVKNMI